MIVVAPHSYCTPALAVEHQCDIAAGRFATMLAATAVRKFGRNNVALLVADAPRPRGDYNRAETRQTSWRGELRAMVDQMRSHGHGRPILLEIHSFPAVARPGSSTYSGAITVLNNQRLQSTAARMIDWLVGAGIDARGVVGSDLNDIQLEFERTADCYLLEINESPAYVGAHQWMCDTLVSYFTPGWSDIAIGIVAVLIVLVIGLFIAFIFSGIGERMRVPWNADYWRHNRVI